MVSLRVTSSLACWSKTLSSKTSVFEAVGDSVGEEGYRELGEVSFGPEASRRTKSVTRVRGFESTGRVGWSIGALFRIRKAAATGLLSFRGL